MKFLWKTSQLMANDSLVMEPWMRRPLGLRFMAAPASFL